MFEAGKVIISHVEKDQQLFAGEDKHKGKTRKIQRPNNTNTTHKITKDNTQTTQSKTEQSKTQKGKTWSQASDDSQPS
jgi:hypothetical protein